MEKPSMISMIETFLLVICYSKELNYLLLKFFTATLPIILKPLHGFFYSKMIFPYLISPKLELTFTI